MTSLATALDRYFVAICLAIYGITLALQAAIFWPWARIMQFGWIITQFHVDYVQFGFAKRALIATLVAPIFALMEDRGIGERVFIAVFDLAVFVIFLVIVQRALRALPAEAQVPAAWLRALIILSPIGVAQWAFDIGRFDHVNYVLTALAILAAMQSRYWLAGVLIAVGMLVHEAILFYGLPPLFAYLLAHRVRWIEFLKITVLPAILAVVIALYGNVDQAYMVEQLGEQLAGSAGVWGRGLWGIRWDMSAINWWILAIYLIPTYLLLTAIRIHSPMWPLLGLMTFAPVALYLLGVDYLRWVQLCLACIGLCLIPLMRDGIVSFRERPVWPGRVAILWLLVPLGPIGVLNGLPYIQKVVLGTIN